MNTESFSAKNAPTASVCVTADRGLVRQFPRKGEAELSVSFQFSYCRECVFERSLFIQSSTAS